jgi:hypothetical protein
MPPRPRLGPLALALALALALGAPRAGAEDCPDPAPCIGDYLSLPTRLPPESLRQPPLTDAEVDALVAGIGEQPLAPGPLGQAELAAAVERALGLSFLLRGMAERPLEVRASESDAGAYRERTLALTDRYLGTLHAILLLPKGAGPFPAVIALHGHGDRAEVYRDEHHGRDYPARGLALLMLTFRGMNIDAYEHRATQVLMANGLHLMGMRVAEALLGLKYLRSLPEIDRDRIALIGHSGGSSTGNLVVRLEPAFRAYVSDHQVDYLSSDPDEPYHCETVPGLYPLHRLVNDLATAPMPVEQVRYSHGRRHPLKLFGRDQTEADEILDFFEQHLQARRARSEP